MKIIAPDWYPKFRCKAGECKHTCCAGWEIDIDEASRARYEALPGEMGERLRKAMAADESGAHFRLTEAGRCPLLNDNGLCDLILSSGEGALCQTCTDHPRFRHFYKGWVEIGLGLCCEEAARLLLTKETPFDLVELADDGVEEKLDEVELAVSACRTIFMIKMLGRKDPLEKRMASMAKVCKLAHLAVSPQETAAFFRKLERLDDQWLSYLDVLAASSQWKTIPAEWEVPLTQLTAYLLFRHFPDSIEDNTMEQRVGVCLLLCRVVAQIFLSGTEQTMDALVEIVRMMSSEIEYSDRNFQVLLDEFPLISPDSESDVESDSESDSESDLE